MPLTLEQFSKHISDSGLLSREELRAFTDGLPPERQPKDAESLARELVAKGKLTAYQATLLWQGRSKGLVLGDYAILDKIGAGGMGMVFKAQHRRMKRVVAIKVLPPAVTESPDSVRRFQREVEAAAKLSHPNIVAAHDAREESGVHFLVMEFVDGTDLAKLVRNSGRLPIDQAVSCVLQAARGLEHAHAEGVIHRDIKPSNLLADKKGTVKILDMGLARFEQSLRTEPLAGTVSEPLTETGRMLGTVDYMAPEQAEDTKHADHRADIYSLGCTLYYLVTGKHMYAADTVLKKILAHREAPIPSLASAVEAIAQAGGDGGKGPPSSLTCPSELHETGAPHLAALDHIFHRMVAKKPEARYQSMHELIRHLEGWQAEHTRPLRPSETAGPFRRDAVGVTAPADLARSFMQGSGVSSEDTRLQDFLQAVKQPPTGTAVAASKPAESQVETLVYQSNQNTQASVVRTSAPHSVRSRRKLAWLEGGAVVATISTIAGLLVMFRTWNAYKETVDQSLAYQEAVSQSLAPSEILDVESVDPDRRAAEWVLSVGGGLQLRTPHGLWGADPRDPAKQLPNEKFQLEWVSLSGLNLKGDPNWSRLSELKHLERLWLGDAEYVATDLAHLQGLPRLKMIGFEKSSLTDDGLQQLRSLPNIEEIQLWGTQVTGKGMQHLKSMVSLKRLSASGTPMDDTGMEHLKDLTELRMLTLDGTRVTDAGAVHLVHLTNLNDLRLDGTKVGDAGLEHLKGLIELRYLGLSGTRVTDAGIVHLAGLSSLTELHLEGTKVSDACLDHIQKLTNLKKLVMWDTRVTKGGIATLQDALPDCKIEF